MLDVAGDSAKNTTYLVVFVKLLFVIIESESVVKVTSITDPPFELGSNVELHCSVNPDPSVGRQVQLQYSWRGNDGQFSTSNPNITIAITWTHYRASYYYCEVSVNDYVIGVGSILVKITGTKF